MSAGPSQDPNSSLMNDSDGDAGDDTDDDDGGDDSNGDDEDGGTESGSPGLVVCHMLT